MEGTPFGRYRLLELLGRGGMGEVWRAHDTETDRIVAVKVLPASWAENEKFKERFRREAHQAARLNNPHVIPIHTYGEIDGRLFVDMRLIEGRDLQAVLADGPLETARAVRIVEEVAKALNAAHKVGLVHRDVKPSNILLDDDDFAYLIDFGIARAADDTGLTSTGQMLGTWHYMAPERFSADKVDARSDVYALACVLYECLTGRQPFQGDSVERQVAAHLNTPPPRPSAQGRNVPTKLDAVIATGMAKDPAHRYSTTVELARAAREAITAPIPRPTPHASPAPVTTPPPIPSAPRSAAYEPPLQPPGSVSPTSPTQPRGPQSRPPEQRQALVGRPQKLARRRRSRRRTIVIAAALLALFVVAGLIIGQMIIRSNYYVTANNGTVVIMRGIQGSLLGYHFYEPHLLGCISERNDLSLITVGQPQNGCRLLKVDDLDKSGRTQVVAGLPTGSLDQAITQIHKLVQQSLLPVCAPSVSASAPPPPAPSTPGPTSPPTPSPSDTALPPAPREPGTDCRAVA